MKHLYRSTLLALVACLLAVCLASPAAAADKMGKEKVQHNVADTWMFWPKHGENEAFVAGMKKHVAWRKSAGDPFEWQVYTPVVGSKLGYYLVRSGNHTWADMDTEDAWGQKTEAGKHYQEDVGVHVWKYQHFFGVANEEMSHWINDKGYRYFGVSTYHFKSGHGADINEVLKKVHEAVTKQKWPYSYSIGYTVGGKGGMTFVTPMKNWAGMAEPSPSLMDVMTKAMGSKEAARKLFDKFSAAVKSREYTIYMYRADLSTPE